MLRFILPAAFLALAGCAQFQSASAVVVQPTLDWRSMATLSDRDRLRDWRSAFVDALRAARAGGHSTDVERESPRRLPKKSTQVSFTIRVRRFKLQRIPRFSNTTVSSRSHR